MLSQQNDPDIPVILDGTHMQSLYIKNVKMQPLEIPHNTQNPLINFLKQPTTKDKTKKLPCEEPLPLLW